MSGWRHPVRPQISAAVKEVRAAPTAVDESGLSALRGRQWAVVKDDGAIEQLPACRFDLGGDDVRPDAPTPELPTGGNAMQLRTEIGRNAAGARGENVYALSLRAFPLA